MAWAALSKIQESSRIINAGQSIRTLVVTLKNWAGDHNGAYPDSDDSHPKTSNDAFRLLIRAGLLDTEQLYGGEEGPWSVVHSEFSPYVPDGNIGAPPDFAEALKPGECHWCLTKGLSDAESGDAPLIFENGVDSAWPPSWNADAIGAPIPGRAWHNSKIIIGRNDGSISAEKLNATSGTKVGLKQDALGLDLFTRWRQHGEFLDVARP